ncbi:MAG: hypothetical protein M1383_04005 [Patescibacteria group bacterium]|nr:hypothetical protein [Patescibacteria group bacterium]
MANVKTVVCCNMRQPVSAEECSRCHRNLHELEQKQPAANPPSKKKVDSQPDIGSVSFAAQA